MLASSELLTWYGIGESSSRALYVAAGLAVIVAIPAVFSIGPLILLVAVLRLSAALTMRRAMRP